MAWQHTQIEYTVATLMAVVLLALLASAMLNARAAVRDDLRKTDLTNLKRGIEMYNNQHNFYPAPPSEPSDMPKCTTVTDTSSWLFAGNSILLRGQYLNAIPHDVRESRGHIYMYCATDILQGSQALGYYLEAQLEVKQPDIVAHDEDDLHNFDYRVLHDNGKILYRVCGGTENQCTPVKS